MNKPNWSGALCIGAALLVTRLMPSVQQWLGLSHLQMSLLVMAVALPCLIIGIKVTWRRAEAPGKAMERRFAAEDAQMLEAFKAHRPS